MVAAQVRSYVGAAGLCHSPGYYEAVYSDMPPYGLGKVGKLVPARNGTPADLKY